MGMKEIDEANVLEINMGEILYCIVNRIRLIILVGILCAAAVFIPMKFMRSPVYRSTTSILVHIQASQLSDEYAALATSSEVTKMTLDSLKLDCSEEELKRKISASTESGTRILKISVADQNPENAKIIADAVRDNLISRIRSEMKVSNIRVVKEADVPTSPAGKSAAVMGVFAGLAGIFAAVFIIMIRTVFRDTISSPDEVERYAGLETIGLIPSETFESDKDNQQFFADYVEEAYSMLRTNILLCGEKITSVAMVGCTSGAGTTTITWKLAHTLAEIGKNVLVIDADMRKTGISEYCRVQTGQKGLADYLSGICEVKDCICPASCEHLYAVISANTEELPSNLLSNGKFRTLIDEAEKDFDYILVDCPSMSDAIDAVAAAKECDACAVVIQADRTKRYMVKSVVKQLVKANPGILGAVLNRFDVRKHKCYGNYYKRA